MQNEESKINNYVPSNRCFREEVPKLLCGESETIDMNGNTLQIVKEEKILHVYSFYFAQKI